MLGGDDGCNNNVPVVCDRTTVLGSGSFACVYAGTLHHTRVAIKVFKEEVDHNQSRIL